MDLLLSGDGSVILQYSSLTYEIILDRRNIRFADALDAELVRPPNAKT